MKQDICVLIAKLDMILDSVFGLTSRRCFLFLISKVSSYRAFGMS